MLRVLALAGPPYRMSPTELADVVVRSSGGMTQILDRLERAGLVARAADPTDRRKVVVGLTGAGRDTAAQASARYLDARQELLGELSTTEVAELDGAVHRLLELLERNVMGEPLSAGPA